MGGGGHGRRGRRLSGHKKQALDAVRNDINITPLVDVVLVLLIIFMVVTPLMARGREVPLPKTKNHSQEKDALQPVVALDAAGDVWFDKEKLGPLDDGNKKRLTAMIQRSWDSPKSPEASGKVYIKAAAELPYSKVYPLIMMVNEMNVTTIELATNEMKDK